VSIGVGPTPIAGISRSIIFETDGGIMVTGSDNPPTPQRLQADDRAQAVLRRRDVARDLGKLAAAGDVLSGSGGARNRVRASKSTWIGWRAR
jgi:hypothetical protein